MRSLHDGLPVHKDIDPSQTDHNSILSTVYLSIPILEECQSVASRMKMHEPQPCKLYSYQGLSQASDCISFRLQDANWIRQAPM